MFKTLKVLQRAVALLAVGVADVDDVRRVKILRREVRVAGDVPILLPDRRPWIFATNSDDGR